MDAQMLQFCWHCWMTDYLVAYHPAWDHGKNESAQMLLSCCQSRAVPYLLMLLLTANHRWAGGSHRFQSWQSCIYASAGFYRTVNSCYYRETVHVLSLPQQRVHLNLCTCHSVQHRGGDMLNWIVIFLISGTVVSVQLLSRPSAW